MFTTPHGSMGHGRARLGAPRLSFSIGALIVFGLACPLSRGQAVTPPVISVKSNLVSVPVFVLNNNDNRGYTQQDKRCEIGIATAFAHLLPSEPFEPKDCEAEEVRGLSVNDFQLFEDGAKQKIENATEEDWWLAVRDNLSWHAEISHTPAGIWGSAIMVGSTLFPIFYSHFYNLVYVPPASDRGCHQIRVKVDQPHAKVSAREEYCAGESPSDVLAGTKEGESLERDLDSGKSGKILLLLQAGTFLRGRDAARVDISLWFPWEHLNHSWNRSDWDFRGRIGVLGAVYKSDGTVAARFSDLLYPRYWRFVVGRFTYSLFTPGLSESSPWWLPTSYETQLDLPPGKYQLKVVLSDGEKFGRAEMPLDVEGYDAKGLGLSSIFLCNRFRYAHVAAVERMAANFAPQYVPLVSKGIEFTPTGDKAFFPGEPLVAYFQAYEPLLTSQPDTKVQAHVRILDAKSGAVLKNFDPVNVASYEHEGSTTIAVARKIPFDQLHRGKYRLEVQATDSAGRSTVWRSADFTIEKPKEH